MKKETTAIDYLRENSTLSYIELMEQYAKLELLEARKEMIQEALKPLYLMRRLRKDHGYFGGADNGAVIEREIKLLEEKLNK